MSKITAQNGLKKIDGLIRTIGTNYKSVQERVQECAILIIEHAEAFGDCTRAIKLVRSLPRRERNSLIGYFMLFSPIGVAIGKDSTQDKCRLLKPESKNYNDFNIAGARANNWFDDPANVNPENPSLDTFGNVAQGVEKFLDRMIKNAEKDDKIIEQDRKNVIELATHLKQDLAKFRAIRLDAKAASTPSSEVEADLPVNVAA